MTLRTLNYGNYGIFLIMGHAGFCPSTESLSDNQGLGLKELRAVRFRARATEVREYLDPKSM